MINSNKELFLFEKPVDMNQGVEQWLMRVESTM